MSPICGLVAWNRAGGNPGRRTTLCADFERQSGQRQVRARRPSRARKVRQQPATRPTCKPSDGRRIFFHAKRRSPVTEGRASAKGTRLEGGSKPRTQAADSPSLGRNGAADYPTGWSSRCLSVERAAPKSQQSSTTTQSTMRKSKVLWTLLFRVSARARASRKRNRLRRDQLVGDHDVDDARRRPSPPAVLMRKMRSMRGLRRRALRRARHDAARPRPACARRTAARRTARSTR